MKLNVASDRIGIAAVFWGLSSDVRDVGEAVARGSQLTDKPRE